MSIKKLADTALQVQDACNLSGVIHSWSKTISELRQLCPSLGTTEINQHPINVLFADKVASLTGSGNIGTFTEAYNECVRLAAEPVLSPV